MTKHWEWLEQQLQYKNPEFQMSPFGKNVAQIIGTVWRGIYHLPQGSYIHERTKWDDPTFIRVVIPDNGLATWDFDNLTKLVVLCHDYCIRVQIDCAGMKNINLRFHRRKGREGGMAERHPTIEQAIHDPENNWRPTKEEVLNVGK